MMGIKRILSKINIFRAPADDHKIKWSLYLRVWRDLGLPYWKWLLAGIICTIIAATGESFSVLILKQVIDKGFVDKNMADLYHFGLLIIATFGGKNVFSYAKDMIMSKTGLMASNNLQSKIYRKMMQVNIGDFYDQGIGKYLNYFGLYSGAVLSLVTTTIISLVQQTATLLMMLGVMLWVAPQLFLTLMVLVPGVVLPMVWITRKRKKLTLKSFGVANASTQHVNQSLQGIKTIQSFGTAESESQQFDKILDQSAKIALKTTKYAALRSPLMEIIISIGLCMTLILGGHFITSGAMTIGDFTAFVMALTASYKPLKSVTGVGQTLVNGLMSAEILFNFLDSESKITDAPNAVPLTGNKFSVAFDRVSFAYNQTDGDVLKRVSFAVPSNKVCAFVGESGGGKSTIFNIIQRFYDPGSGRVLINGKDIRKYTLQTLRENIAEVSQDVFLFKGTIADNIKYGNQDATMAQVEAAAKMANAHEFIMKMPHKYRADVGERGALLSGGQKQRIAIARAILKDAPILLLDEATSALDTQSEKLIQGALKNLMKNRTTFVIAHRLSTIIDADIICVVKGGEIIERGTDAELTELRGEYKKLRDIQFRKK
ncbi:MAG: ABC transporter ATP-binding protein/permease [Rickettsiales bacterium]|jgi:ABC-type multidrug transport system fused ATPase/permease subunit|nr:ABC transporter ATP-binding protein/permease [Rickettsiales bacterium]